MHSRIARAKFRPEQSEEVITVAQESIPTFQRQAGFQSVIYHYDRASGWGFSVSAWDTKEHADAAAEGTRSVVEAFAPFRSNPGATGDTVEGPLPVFEIVAQGGGN